MAKFCKCGSLVVNGSCTNSKCKNSTPSNKVTFKQMDLIKELDTTEDYDFSNMTKQEASTIIEELLDKMGDE